MPEKTFEKEQDSVIISGTILRTLQIETENLLGAAACVVWYILGKVAGKNIAKTEMKKPDSKLKPVPSSLDELLTESGWGTVITTNYEPNRFEVIVKIEKCILCRGIQFTRYGPMCHLMRGYLAGIYEALFKTSVDCTETKCLAKGDTYCEFHVRKPS